MSELDQLKSYSEEIQDIMGYIPKWVVRRGITVMLIVLLLILIGSYFVKYPELIHAQIILTTETPPVLVESKSGGIIEELFFHEKDSLLKGDIIAIIENRANYEDIVFLKNEILTDSIHNNWKNEVLGKALIANLSLGEIQDYYTDYVKSWNQYHYYLEKGHISKKEQLLAKQINKQEEYLTLKKEQKGLLNEELRYIDGNFQRDSSLYGKGVIALTEFEETQKNYITKKSSCKDFEAFIKNIETNILIQNENLIELQMQYESDIVQYELDLDKKFQTLKSAFNQWEMNFLIQSPIDGVITFTKFWSSKQLIQKGDIIAAMIPFDSLNIIGKLLIPFDRFGKVKAGQKVNIKLTGFPYMEYGMLIGEIKSISQVPITSSETKNYMAEVKLVRGMNTTYKEKIRFIQEMNGSADIITKETRLFNRFFQPLKALIDEHF